MVQPLLLTLFIALFFSFLAHCKNDFFHYLRFLLQIHTGHIMYVASINSGTNAKEVMIKMNSQIKVLK